jgi:Amidohydrolase
MAHAVAGYRHSAINNYLAADLPASDLLIGFGTPADTSKVCHLISVGKLAALKMYFRCVEPPLRTVRQVFPDPVLKAAEIAGIPIILHLPTPLPHGLKEVLDIVARYPRLTIVLAHLGGHGGQFFSALLIPAFRALIDVPTVFMDTALVFDRDLVRAAVEILGPDRILFGTDEPLSLIRATGYAHPNLGPRLFAPGYHWARDDGAPKEVKEHVRILLHIQIVEALIEAVDQDSHSLQTIFHDTAERVLVRC